MHRSIFSEFVLAAGIVMCLTASTNAQPHSSQLFTGGNRCDHVIQMMLRHGIDNSFDRRNTSSLLNHLPLGGFQVPDNEIGDLQIAQVNLLPPEGTACGPKVSVVVLNDSCRAVHRLHVSAVAVFGNILPHSPNCTVAVQQINPKEALEVVLQLPTSAYSMGNRNGEILGFERLVVAIDSFDELLETNEANNIKSYIAAEIGVATTVITQPAVTVLSESNDVPVDQGQVQDTAAPRTQAPLNGEVPVDAMDLDQPTTDSLRSAIEQLGEQNAEQPVSANGL